MTSVLYPQFSVEDIFGPIWIWPVCMAFGMAIARKTSAFGKGRPPYLERVVQNFVLYALIWVPAWIVGWAFERGAEASGYANPGLWKYGALAITAALALAAILSVTRFFETRSARKAFWL